MKLSQPSLSLLEETIKQAIGKYTCGCEQTVVTDIHLQANQSSGEFFIFDDDDKELANATIEEWMTYEGDDFYENMERILSNLLCDILQENEQQTKRQLHRPGDSPVFDELMEAYLSKRNSQHYREAVSARCRKLLNKIVRPQMAVSYMEALGKRNLLWDLLLDALESNVLEVYHAE